MTARRTARHAASRTAPTSSTRPSATRVLTTLLVGLLLLCGIYQYAAAGLGPERPHPRHASQQQQQQAQQASQEAARPLLDPSVGRGAGSATCKHAPRSPRCMREGGTTAAVRDRGAIRPAPAGDGQTVLLDGEGARPAEVPGRVPGRGGWVSELGPSAA